MNNLISIIQLTLAIIMIVLILLQQKGSGLGVAFGGASSIYSTKRGLDAVLFKATIVISILFFGVSLLRVII